MWGYPRITALEPSCNLPEGVPPKCIIIVLFIEAPGESFARRVAAECAAALCVKEGFLRFAPHESRPELLARSRHSGLSVERQESARKADFQGPSKDLPQAICHLGAHQVSARKPCLTIPQHDRFVISSACSVGPLRI